MQLDPYLSPHTKFKAKWIKHLNLRPQTIKLLQENIGENPPRIWYGQRFIEKYPKSTGNKSKNGQMKSHQVKKLPYSRGNKKEITHRMGENI